MLKAVDSFNKAAKAMEKVAPSSFETECLPLMESFDVITESFADTPIKESQRAELVDIYERCYDSIQQEVEMTKVEFEGLSISSICLIEVQDASDIFSDLNSSINLFSKMSITKEEDNNAAKFAAAGLALNINLLGGKVVVNRRVSCPLEISGFNSEQDS